MLKKSLIDPLLCTCHICWNVPFATKKLSSLLLPRKNPTLAKQGSEQGSSTGRDDSGLFIYLFIHLFIHSRSFKQCSGDTQHSANHTGLSSAQTTMLEVTRASYYCWKLNSRPCALQPSLFSFQTHGSFFSSLFQIRSMFEVGWILIDYHY